MTEASQIARYFGALPSSNVTKSAYLALWVMAIPFVSYTQAYHNWDMIAYAAAAYELSGLSGEALREAAYSDVERMVSVKRFAQLTVDGSDYRPTVYENAAALEQQLPFYKIRYLYIWLVYAVGQLVGSFAQATVLVSAVSGALIVFVSAALFWSSRSLLTFYLVPPALYVAGVGFLAQTSTPDALATLAAAALCFAILKERHILTAILLVALPLLRTDYIIFVCAIGLLLFLNRRYWLTAISIPLVLQPIISHRIMVTRCSSTSYCLENPSLSLHRCRFPKTRLDTSGPMSSV